VSLKLLRNYAPLFPAAVAGVSQKVAELLYKFEQWTRRVYRPKEAKWKRPVLMILSIFILVACSCAAYAEIKYGWTDGKGWFGIIFFALISTLGLVVSIFCKDYWVAILLGRPSL
jgi:hypothetical protein